MARFVFRLEAVRELRRHLEQEQKDRLARERQTLSALQQERDRLLREQVLWSKAYLEISETGTGPTELMRISRYFTELDDRISQSLQAIARQERTVDEAREELAESMKESKKMDKLYDRQFSSYTVYEQRRQEHEIEEMIAGRRTTA